MTTECSTTFRRIVSLQTTMLPIVLLLGCGKPTEDSRQNRRLVDSVQTSFITGNQKELAKCKDMLAEQHSKGALSDANHQRLNEIIDQAMAGKGAEAGEALNTFRKEQPFPN